MSKESMAFPVFVVSGGFVKGYKKNIIPLRRCNLYGLVKGFYQDASVYDHEGNVWTVADMDSPYQINLWTKLIANLFFNPRIIVRLTWAKTGTYSYKDFQEVLCDIVDKDEDYLTEQLGHDELITLIQDAESFDFLFDTLKKKKVV
ncbi:MAG: hypothetical protein K8S27_05020 [Candidatus Omnitrophica bacterium]|nr:hypothetical protein [Candidatus Omnitrophota bacterium]